ncbi:pentatricopeptide repeat-containing protein [Cocos nucifera]|uniref:Pentatricopeptide repeat-containing protein n=1 Tax=Cocos nucifera TaxID=13894 RepID=A0A8K0IDS5_COCNU|nr:pentatricopeptide repeat-containing protein [Cocos nucifera]
MAIQGGRSRTLLPLSIPNATKTFPLSSSSHPSITPSASHPPPSDRDDETVISTAVSILREQRSKSRWSFLKSVYHPAGFSAAQAAEILRRVRNRPHLALRFFLWTQRHSLCRHDLHSLAAVAHVLARGRLRSNALSLLQSAIRSHDPTSASAAIGGADTGRPPEIFEALAKAYRAFDSAPFVFDLLIRAYLQVKRLDRAVQIVRILLSRGIQPEIGTSNSLIRSVSRARGSDFGFEIYEEIFKTKDGNGAAVRVRVSPKVQTFNTLLLALYREGKLEKSEEIRKEMEIFKCEPNVFTYSILMAGFCDEGRIKEARKLWEEMVAEGIEPDIIAFNTLISGYCEVGETESAEELFREMVLSEIEPTENTYEHLIKGHCYAGEVDSALLLYKDMKRRGFGIGVSAVDELLGVMCEKRRVVEGLGILRAEMRREEFCPSRKSYGSLIRGFCEEGEMEEALKLQAEMAGKGFEVDLKVYSAFIQGYGKQGDVEKVRRLKDEMFEMGLHVEGE